MLPAAKLLNHCWFKWQLLMLFKTLGEFLSCNFFGGSKPSSFYLISENSQTHTIWNQIWWTPELDEYHFLGCGSSLLSDSLMVSEECQGGTPSQG